MIKIRNLSYLLLAVLFIFSACKEEDDEKPGQPPTANAGQDVMAKVNSTVQLNGTATDADNDPLTISWSVSSSPQGSSASINNASALNATFIPDVEGNYTLQLSVSDGVYDPVTDEVIITAEEAAGDPPVVKITDDRGLAISEDNDNNTVTITQPLALLGQNTTDPESDVDDLTFSWSVTDKPEGSNPSISNDDQQNAEFVPDAVGEYEITLSVEDPDGNTATLAVKVVANAEPVVISENVSESTVWEDIFDDPNLPDYVVVNSISVNSDLTVEPGVVVHLDQDVVITVNTNGGELISKGSSENMITFTSSDVDSDIYWGGFSFLSSSSKNEFDYTQILYSGGEDNLVYASGYRAAAIGLTEEARLKITNSTIANSKADGIFAIGSNSLSSFSNNTFENNANFPLSLSANQAGVVDASNSFKDNPDTEDKENQIRIYDSSLNDDQSWVELSDDASYLFEGDINIKAALDIAAGALLEFEEGVTMTVESEGALVASGSESKPIIFTSANISDGQKWGGLRIESSSTKNELDYVEISHAGGDDSFIYISGYLSGSIGLVDNARLKLTNSTIENSASHGLVMASKAKLESFSNNNFTNNSNYPVYTPANLLGLMDNASTFTDNGDNVVAVYKSTFDAEASYTDTADPKWVALSGTAKYLFLGDLTINDDLIVEAGAYLAFDEQVSAYVNSGGSLVAVGTADSKITFSAYNQSGSDNWGGIVFKSDDSNELSYAEVSYAGNDESLIYKSGYYAANIGVSDNSVLSITNTTVSNSKSYGLVIHGGATVNSKVQADADRIDVITDANTFSGNAMTDVDF